MTYLDNIIYVVCEDSSTIRLYDTDTLNRLNQSIEVVSMRDPRDIVACCYDRELYVAEYHHIWQVSVDDFCYVRWLRDQWDVCRLSLTSRRLLVTSRGPPTVRQYNTTDKQLLSVVRLPQYVCDVHHAVETTHGTFVVSHRGTPHGQWQNAVSA